jgi:ABC-type transport system involved in cytochrome bd biosynthesis fused ATPase/permease subunit
MAATAQSRLAHQFATSVRQRILDQLLFRGSDGSATAVAVRLNVRVHEVERGVDQGLLAQWRALAQLVPLMAAWVWLSPFMAMAAVVVLGPFALVVGLARRAWRRSHEDSMTLAERLYAGVEELARNIDLWRTYGAGERVHASLANLGERAEVIASRVEGARNALSSANEVLAALAVLLAVGVAEVYAVPIARGNVLAGAAVLFMAYRPLRDLGDARAALHKGAAALESLDEHEAFLTASSARVTTVPRSARRWGRELLVVEQAGIARLGVEREGGGTSFHAAPGEIVAIVGPTGAGKSTLLRILLGLEPSATGEVRYGACNLSRALVGPNERPFAWVPQDAAMLAGTLAENVLLAGQSEQAPGALRNALALIGAAQLMEELADARLGADGLVVSGGERKWIALARALASELPVLLLDEPTAGLDAASRDRVLAALAGLRDKRTILLVTHERELLRLADRVIALGGGRLPAQGLTKTG